MSISFTKGAIVKSDVFHKDTFYDVSNYLATAQFDGKGNISRYSVVNKWEIFENFYTMLAIDDVQLDYYTDKKVTMLGKMQTVEFTVNDSEIIIRQFLDEKTNAIFCEYEILSKRDVDFNLTYNFGINLLSYLKNLFTSRLSVKTIRKILKGFIVNKLTKDKGIIEEGGVYIVKNNPLGDFYLDIAMAEGGKALEKEGNYYNQYEINTKIKANEAKKIRFVISAGYKGDYTYTNVKDCLIYFNKHYAEAESYIKNLPCPIAGNEYLEAYYKSLYNCSLSLYKEADKFKGFIAGITYQSPLRTYYRDGYWTVLSILPNRPDLVKNEIITLACGINKDGKCPSAVKSNFKNWWGDHYDSPSFFIIMIYDYVKHTKDYSVLDVKWRKGTILDAAKMVIDRISLLTDDSGLLVKTGEYNRRDWADNVFRTGYVTYDEALYARALFALSELMKLKGNNELAFNYFRMYNKVKDAINNILWDDKKGYYVNYKSDNFVENNLSLDTVVTVLFGIADKEKSIKILNAMEKTLESKNNKEQKAGDYGVLAVYPFYKRNADVVLKSSLPYYYHNGGDWPYLSGIYAYAKLMYGMDYMYPLTRWFDYNTEKGNYTPIEFYSPTHKDGSLLQGWSSTGAFLLSYPEGNFFR